MKRLVLVLIITLAGIVCQAQGQWDTINKKFLPVVFVQDTAVNPICKERGHVKSESCVSTLMNCEPYLIETDSTTVEVYPPCNWITYECVRCGKLFTEQEKETRRVIWRKPKNPDFIHPVMNYDKLEPTPSYVLPGNMEVYMPVADTISWFDLYDCLIPPKDKEVRVWKNGHATIWIHGIDSITFKDTNK